MNEFYAPELLKQLDEIIKIISIKRLIKGDDFSKACFDILEKDHWVKNKRYENRNVIVSYPGNDFDILLAEGTFSEQYNRKKTSELKTVSHNYHITNIDSPYSTIATGKNITQTATISASNIQSSIKEAIEQLKHEKSLTSGEKSEINDYFEELDIAYSKGEQPVNSTLRGLARWSERFLSIGGSIASLYSVIKPLLTPFLD